MLIPRSLICSLLRRKKPKEDKYAIPVTSTYSDPSYKMDSSHPDLSPNIVTDTTAFIKSRSTKQKSFIKPLGKVFLILH